MDDNTLRGRGCRADPQEHHAEEPFFQAVKIPSPPVAQFGQKSAQHDEGCQETDHGTPPHAVARKSPSGGLYARCEEHQVQAAKNTENDHVTGSYTVGCGGVEANNRASEKRLKRAWLVRCTIGTRS